VTNTEAKMHVKTIINMAQITVSKYIKIHNKGGKGAEEKSQSPKFL